MTWFLLAFMAQFLFATSNIIDKYIVERYIKNEGLGGLYIFTCILAIVTAVIVGALNPEALPAPIWYAGLAALSGILFLGAFIPYYMALRISDASVITPMYLMIPIVTYVLGLLFLGEVISIQKILGGVVIIVAAIGVSIDFTKTILRPKLKTVLLMALSSFLIAMVTLIFKVVAVATTYWTTIFWESIGQGILGVVLFSTPFFRKQFFKLLVENTTGIISINVINEVVNIGGHLLLGYAVLLAPIALVSVVGGFQPVIVFTLAIFLTIFFPKFIRENIDQKTLLYKGFFIAVIFGASVLIQ